MEAQVAAGEAAARALAIADAPEPLTVLAAAPASGGGPASTMDQPVGSSGAGTIFLEHEAAARALASAFSESGAEGDPVVPGLRSHFEPKAREEAESERRTQISRELREAPTPEEGK